uniref:Uncharacterized protein n=1 Tax=Magallana gigas TaxID=29159 RepID=K1PKL0_MAGGI
MMPGASPSLMVHSQLLLGLSPMMCPLGLLLSKKRLQRLEILLAAIKRYFTSQKEAENRQKKNKTEVHKKRQATYERKKEKLKRTKVTIEKKYGWSKEKKTKVHQFLQFPEAHKYMSSDEEVDNGFLSHPYSWESKEWRIITDSLDKKFLETCPPRSKQLLAKRTRGFCQKPRATQW